MLLTWNPFEHTDDENTRWCWLRAMEWRNWPIFLSPSLVPIMWLFWNWQIVALVLVVCNWMWYFIVGRRGRFVSVPLANIGVFIVKAKWIVCPMAAVYFYYNGMIVESIISLLWPLFPYAAMIVHKVLTMSCRVSTKNAYRGLDGLGLCDLGISFPWWAA